jgi:hypothetical protein
VGGEPTALDMDALERVAKAIGTPTVPGRPFRDSVMGPWIFDASAKAYNCNLWAQGGDVPLARVYHPEVGAYLAAAAPATVLALVAALRSERAKKCAAPGVAMCAKEWQADHQALQLAHYGLDAEFAHDGCDAIGSVAAALVVARERASEWEAACKRAEERSDELTEEAMKINDELRAAKAEVEKLYKALALTTAAIPGDEDSDDEEAVT